MERTKPTLSVDPTIKADRPNRWVLTDEYGYAELVHEAPNLSAVQVAGLTETLASAYDVKRVMIRAHGIGAGIADLVSAVPLDKREWEVWVHYPGQRKAWNNDPQ